MFYCMQEHLFFLPQYKYNVYVLAGEEAAMLAFLLWFLEDTDQ